MTHFPTAGDWDEEGDNSGVGHMSIDGAWSIDESIDLGPNETDGGQAPVIGKRETRQVAQRKLYVWIVLLVSAIATAVGAFVYIRNSEEVAYQADFQSNAHKVLEAIGKSLEQTLKSLDALTVSIVSHAHATNQTWPFVTVPDFTLRAAKTISLSDVVFMSILPLVTNQTRHEWEEYAVNHDTWTNTSVQLQSEYNLYHGTLQLAYESVNVIWGDFGDIAYNLSRDYLPQWQSYPNVNTDGAAVYNFDWLSISSVDAPNTALYQHHMVISEAYLLPDPTDPVDVAETEIWTEWISDFVQPGQPYDEPASDLYFPIFDEVEQIRAPSSVADVAGNEEYDPSMHNVVGTLVSTLQWRNLIKDILPPGSNGMVVVFENPCNPTFTYQVNGPSVTYLGRGDLHDTNYNGDRITSKLVNLNSFAVGTGSLYSGPPVDTTFCPFTIHVYGSDVMHKDYTNNDPVVFAILAVTIFLFTTLVFCFYDYTVEMRQKKVLTTAVKSNAVVSSLFPEQVREQLVDSVQEQQQKGTKSSSYGHDTSKSRVHQFLEEGDLMDDDKSAAAAILSSPPIATLYPETTVMFADIANFTKWSSQRDPVAVFTLLETLYGAFDAIAKRRKVFKVETIGDCYVAVVGLPMAEPKHAVVMAKFAMDCRNKMLEVTRDLSGTLGSDTGMLTLRVGLHSGPTTAGVLRGAKSRFQLFGDTVNTAARMESNGTPNKIHISQSTADLLTAAGKGFWITKREELIEAKGKGRMQTYWVSPPSGTGSVAMDTKSADCELLEYEVHL